MNVVRTPPLRSRNGYSLVELIVALSVVGLVLGVGTAAFLGVADRGRTLIGAAERRDLLANFEALVRSTLGNLDMSRPPALEGGATDVRYRSWCVTTERWLERCHVTLASISDSAGPAIVMTQHVESRNGSVRLGPWKTPVPDNVSFIYLADPASGGRWTASWTAPSLPYAVGLVTGPDTLILPVGQR